jgi:adenosylcobinamide-phosphate synthase
VKPAWETTAAIAVGCLIDQLFGEPPVTVHPVVAFGKFATRLEQWIYQDNRSAGTLLCASGVGLGFGAGLALNRLVGRNMATAVAVGASVAGKMLAEEATRVARLLESNDLSAARLQVRSLVGRTTDELDELEISRAVIESLAENSVDAVIASIFWAAIGGAPAVLAHRAANTLDAMVGHHSVRYENFGWASARLDDLANWIPARLAALFVASVAPHRAGRVAAIIRRDAPQHPSPNGGVIEAAFAEALGIKLGGTNRYGPLVSDIEERGVLGDGRTPHVHDIARAVTLARQIEVVCAATVPVCVTTLANSARRVVR